MMKKIKRAIKTAVPFLIYIMLYLVVFYLIRFIKPAKYYYPYTPFDFKIPYIRFFVVPYLSWLGWVPFISIYTLFHNEHLYKKISHMMMISMTLYTIISLILPTALFLRPTFLNCKDIFCQLTVFLYGLTPETYVFPSLHVFHSLVAFYAILHGKGKLVQNRYFKVFGFIWTILICLSTVFVRQHSIIDMFGGIFLFITILQCFKIYDYKKGDVLRN